MADELSLSSLRVSYEKGAAKPPAVNREAMTITVAGTTYEIDRVQTLTAATETAVALGSIAVGGIWILFNNDVTNFISLRAASGETPLIKLLAQEWTLFRSHPSSVPTAEADTGDCDLVLSRWAP